MKKSLVALAVLAAAGAASAQSSVTLFGIIDTSISHYSGSNGGASRTVLGNSGLNTSRIGFRGVEDLGGGLAASFWIEGALGTDDGTAGSLGTGGLDFRRRSTVSLSGGFGEIRLGRDLTATHHNDDVFSPFGTNGVGTNVIFSALNQSNALGFGANPNQVRASNMIAYFLPSNLGGFYGQVQYGLHENASSTATVPNVAGRSGQYAGGRFGYANGPVDVAVAYGESEGAIAPGIAFVNPEVRTFNLGASYNLGVVKLFGELSTVRFEQDFAVAPTREDKQHGYLLGVSAPIGAGVVKAAFSSVRRDLEVAGADPRAHKLALGYVHNLSKRTALYATVARVTSKNGYGLTLGQGISGIREAGDGKNSVTGYDFGVRHSF